MNADIAVPVSANGMSHENGVHEQLPAPGEEGIGLTKVNGFPTSGSESAGPNGNPGIVGKLEESGLTVHTESNGLTISKVGAICCVLSFDVCAHMQTFVHFRI